MADPTNPHLGHKLRSLREAKGWSRRTLSDNARIGEATISRVELYGAQPNLATLLALALALGVPVTDLLEDDEPVEPKAAS